MEYIGNNNEPADAFPLGPCQSDCDDDQDCAGPLVCFQRRGGEAVPGCLGDDPSDEDYCVWPDGFNFDDLEKEEASVVNTIEPNPSSWVEEGFALKLYWEEGYNWQNETIERKCEWLLLQYIVS